MEAEPLAEVISGAVAERATGRRPSRTRSLLAAAVVGFSTAVMTYRLLRASGGDEPE